MNTLTSSTFVVAATTSEPACVGECETPDSQDAYELVVEAILSTLFRRKILSKEF